MQYLVSVLFKIGILETIWTSSCIHLLIQELFIEVPHCIKCWKGLKGQQSRDSLSLWLFSLFFFLSFSDPNFSRVLWIPHQREFSDLSLSPCPLPCLRSGSWHLSNGLLQLSLHRLLIDHRHCSNLWTQAAPPVFRLKFSLQLCRSSAPDVSNLKDFLLQAKNTCTRSSRAEARLGRQQNAKLESACHTYIKPHVSQATPILQVALKPPPASEFWLRVNFYSSASHSCRDPAWP